MNYVDAKAGDFYQESSSLNLNTFLNYFGTRPSKIQIELSAIVIQEVQFPDISFWQGDIDYSVMRLNTDTIILRIGQNLWVDDQFETNYLEAKKQGMKVGGYWFYDGRISPQKQAEVLVTALEGKTLELEVFLDWEHNYGGSHEGLQNVVAMMELVELAIRANIFHTKGVGMYTGYYWFRGNSNPITHASQYNYLKEKPLWLAWYTSDPKNVLIPAPWSVLTLWQWGTPAWDWGQETQEIDMNWFNGTRKAFEERYGESTGEPMPISHYELRSNNNVSRSVRDTTEFPRVPHIAGAKIASLEPGKSAKAYPDGKYVYTSNVTYSVGGTTYYASAGDIWWKVFEINNGVIVDGWIAERHLGQTLLTVAPVEDSTPPTLPTINVQLSDPEGNYPTISVEWKPNAP